MKKICCVEHAVPSQVMCVNTMKKGLSVATKVAIQMSCKIGGAPWHVKIPLGGLMTIGFDVARDSADRKTSYGALVASMVIDGRVDYFSCVSRHQNGEELANHFSDNIVKALHAYRDLSKGVLPKQILIYRDGVGDGQIESIQQTEIAKLRECLNKIYGGPNYQLVFIIVTKRINTRLFARSARGHENPPPGTVVDDVITLPERYVTIVTSLINSKYIFN